MTEILCKTCDQCSFNKGNGNPNRYYCLGVRDNCTPHKLICKTERHSEEYTIKRTPRWCPMKNKQSKKYKREKPIKIIILDPEGEYKELAEKFGSEVIKIDPSKAVHINPLEIKFK